MKTGIGKVSARAFLAKNAKVYVACRSLEKGQAAIEDLKRTTGKTDIQWVADHDHILCPFR